MACPASANLDLAIPGWTPPVVDPQKGAKGRGSMLHGVLEPLMKLSNADFKQVAKIVAYMDELRRRRRFNVWTEHSVQATWLKSEPWTTADVVLHVQDELHIVDFKFGRIPVQVQGNKQLLFYAASYADLSPRAHEVHLHVLQPGCDTFVEWTVSTLEVGQFMVEAMKAEDLILAGDTSFNVTDSCVWCPAYPHSRGDKGKPLCPAAMQLLYPLHIDEQEILSG